MKFYLPLFAVLSLAACDVEGSKPLVSDYNGASVKIAQTNFFGEGVRGPKTDAEALRICTTGSKKRAEYASTRQSGEYEVEHLYLCL